MQAKCQLTCYLCQQRYGACIQCAGSSKCFLAFHPSCARSAGLVMETVEPGSDYDTSEAESDSEALPARPTTSHQPAGLDENHNTSNVPSTLPTAAAVKGCDTPSIGPPAANLQALQAERLAGTGAGTPQLQGGLSGAETCKGVTSMAACKRRKRSGVPMQEGTYIGGGQRMMCYCPKHSHVAQTSAVRQGPAPQGALLAAPGSAPVPVHSDRMPASLMHQQSLQHSAQETSSPALEGVNATCDGQTEGHQLPQHKAGCIRGVPFNHACRRGQREPDAIAAALAKRLFVAKTPYMIAGPQRHARHQLPAAHCHANEAPFLTGGASSGHAAGGPGRPQHAAKTQTQRFKEMQQTVGQRLTCGKSAIHGLGAFTKRAHAAGSHQHPFLAEKMHACCSGAADMP